MSSLKPLKLLEEAIIPATWGRYSFRMPDGLDNRFRAPDLATARQWASLHVIATVEQESMRREHLLYTRQRMAIAEATYRQKLNELYDRNLPTGTFDDIDGFDGPPPNLSSEVKASCKTTKRSRTSRKPIVQQESFLEILFAEDK